MSGLILVIANKAYSSWSLRPWLALKQAGAAFTEVVIPLRQPETAATIARWSPAGRVPVLRHGDVVIWESIAILEYVAELFPAAHLWPADPAARAHARTLAAEMHSGFMPLRSSMNMNVRRHWPGRGRTPEVEQASAASPTPMPCTRRWSPASRPTGCPSMARVKLMPMPCSTCRLCAPGTPTPKASRGPLPLLKANSRHSGVPAAVLLKRAPRVLIAFPSS